VANDFLTAIIPPVRVCRGGHGPPRRVRGRHTSPDNGTTVRSTVRSTISGTIGSAK
jgi:hypothetical protein